MKNRKRTITLLLSAITMLIITYSYVYYKNRQYRNVVIELRKEKLKNAKLEDLGGGYYKKLVADSLTKKQMQEEIEKLKLYIKEPLIVEKIVYKFKDKKGDVADVKYKDTIISIEDYYPKKENYFAKYTADISTKGGKSTSNWEFEDQQISIVIGYNDKGEPQLISKFPEYWNVTNIDVQSKPMDKTEEKIKHKSFGWLVGGGYMKHFNNERADYTIDGGIRYKKVYLTVKGATNGSISGSLMIEL